jgi:hypothetical protein
VAVSPDADLATAVASVLGAGWEVGTKTFTGPMRADRTGVPVEAVFCLALPGAPAAAYLGEARELVISTVQIMLRGAVDHLETLATRARQIRAGINLATITGYVDVRVRESEPNYLGKDEADRHLFSLNVEMMHTRTSTDVPVTIEVTPSLTDLFVTQVDFDAYVAAAAASFLTPVSGAALFVPIEDSYTVGVDDITQWEVQANHPGKAHFRSIFGGSQFGLLLRLRLSWGYNISQTGKEIVGEASFWDSLETDYFVDGARVFERYWAFRTSDDSVQGRPIYAYVDRDTGTSNTQLNAYGDAGYVTVNVGGNGASGGNQIVKWVKDGTQILGGRAITWTGTGDKNMLYAQNNLGSNTHLVLSLDQYGRVSLGPGNVFMVGTSSAVVGGEPSMAYFGGTLRTKRTVSGDKTADLKAVVTSLLAALDDSTGYGLFVNATT